MTYHASACKQVDSWPWNGVYRLEEVIFKNSRGREIKLSDDAPFILTEVEGTGAVFLDINAYRSPRRDGRSYVDSALEIRPLSFKIMILANSIDEMIGYRKQLLSAFNPKLGPGKLIYRLGDITREIEAISELAPVFPETDDMRDFKDVMQPGLIQLYCPDPLWQDPFETSNEIVNWIGGMIFPLTLPTQFSTAGEKTINIYNEGDVATPVRIEITGKATNPKIEKKLTGEFIQVNTTVADGEKMIITTHFGNKRVELDGGNVFHKIALESIFFNLDVGDNVVEVTTEDVNDYASTKIIHKNRYTGV